MFNFTILVRIRGIKYSQKFIINLTFFFIFSRCLSSTEYNLKRYKYALNRAAQKSNTYVSFIIIFFFIACIKFKFCNSETLVTQIICNSETSVTQIICNFETLVTQIICNFETSVTQIICNFETLVTRIICNSKL